jgi:translation initiation factor IF-3
VGILKTAEALRYAQERDLDLVEVAPDAKPPVCRVLDYSKYKYEQNQRQKAARKHQQQITIREIKFRPKIAQHDYDTKKGHVERFLKSRDKVKVTIMFRGREQAHPERGEMILNRLAEELEEVAIVEQRPIQDGRNMTMMLGPLRTQESDDAEDGGPQASGGPSKKERRQQKLEARSADAEPEQAAAEPEPEPEPEPPTPEPEPEPVAATPEPVEAEVKPAPAKKAPAKKAAAKRPAKATAAAKDS